MKTDWRRGEREAEKSGTSGLRTDKRCHEETPELLPLLFPEPGQPDGDRQGVFPLLEGPEQAVPDRKKTRVV